MSEQQNIGRRKQLKALAVAIQCFTSRLTAVEIERLHRAFMFKGPQLEAITRIVKGEL